MVLMRHFQTLIQKSKMVLFVYKLFDKRDAFYLQQHSIKYILQCYIFRNTQRIIRCTLKFEDLKPRLKSLFERMIRQGATHCYICRQINKGFLRYPEEFNKFGMSLHDFIKSLKLRVFNTQQHLSTTVVPNQIIASKLCSPTTVAFSRKSPYKFVLM